MSATGIDAPSCMCRSFRLLSGADETSAGRADPAPESGLDQTRRASPRHQQGRIGRYQMLYDHLILLRKADLAQQSRRIRGY
jgi:hypothetical protein